MARLADLDERVLKKRIDEAETLLSPCEVCPRCCKIDRKKGERGFCQAGLLSKVSSFHLHFGEEPPISGWRGSGTIFFTYCSLRCIFCQNSSISHLGEGKELSAEGLSEMMLGLQRIAAHNINLVTPTHYAPQILAALSIAKKEGLIVPIVYNCGGYEQVKTLKLLEGIIDIYMPDFKYGDNSTAERFSSCSDYLEVATEAIKEMHQQVGDLVLKDGVAIQGLLIRHLVMPNDLANSGKVFSIIAKELSPNTAVNIMSQYYPHHMAYKYPEINRRIARDEYKQALKLAKEVGLVRGWRQNENF